MNKAPDTLRHTPKSTAQLTSTSTSLLPLCNREASAVEPVVSRKSEGGCARDGHFFFLWVIDVRTQRHRMAHRRCGKRVKVTSTARKQMKQFSALKKQLWTPLAAALAGRSSTSRRPRVWTQSVPRIYVCCYKSWFLSFSVIALLCGITYQVLGVASTPWTKPGRVQVNRQSTRSYSNRRPIFACDMY